MLKYQYLMALVAQSNRLAGPTTASRNATLRTTS